MRRRTLLPLVLAAALAVVAPATAPAQSAGNIGSVAEVGGAVSGSTSPLGSVFGLAGDSASPLTQTLGSANGSLGNPGPAAPVALKGDCRPTAAHPRPVILLHGTYANADQMYLTALGTTLRQREFCVFAPTYGAYSFAPQKGAMASGLGVSVPQIESVVDDVLARTGTTQVDMVGFSQGAAVGGYVAKKSRPGTVARFASVAGYWGGDPSSMIPGGLGAAGAGSVLDAVNLGGLADLLPEGALRSRWYAPDGTPFARGVDYTLIASTYDPVMSPTSSFPPDSALAAGRAAGATVTETVLQTGCAADRATHDTITNDPRVADLVSNALDPVRPVAVRCAAFA